MSPRENRPLHAAVIILTMLVVVLSVSTYLFSRKFQEQEQVAAAATRARAELEPVVDGLRKENQRLKEVIGHLPAASLADVESAYRRDAIDAVSVSSAAARSYRGMLWPLMSAARAAIAEAVEARLEADLAVVSLAQERSSWSRQEASLRSAHAQLAGDVLAVQRTADVQRAEMTRLWEMLKTQLTAALDDVARWEGRYRQLEARSETEIQGLRVAYDRLLKKWFSESEPQTIRPFGKIVSVDYRSRVVMINLGAADKLPRGLVLQVDDSEDPPRSRRNKGTIEVVRVLDEHLAEARLVHESLTDPLLAGDQLYSHFWHPGQVRHVALAGEFSPKGSGGVSREALRNMISAAGGVIDAECDERGKLTGQLSLETRLVIVAPLAKDGSPEAKRIYRKFLDDAHSLGIEPLTVGRLQERLGASSGETRVVRYDLPANRDTFSPHRAALQDR